MDKFTEARQTLGKSLYAQLKKYGDRLSVRLQFDNKMYFYSTHDGADEKYTCEMGFRFPDGDGLMAVRSRFVGVYDAVSARTKVKDLELAMKYMPVIAKFLEVEAEMAGMGTE